MNNLVSVCVPTWNEEKTIGCTLNSILRQNFPGKIGVLVCANGCTDRTAEIVKYHEKRDSRVRLIEIHERGKPGAWNTCVDQAQSNYVIFCDADVCLGDDSIGLLYGKLISSGKTGVTGLIIPVYNGSGYFAEFLWPKPKEDFVSSKDHFSGGLYGVNKRNLLERMHQLGLDKMPGDIISEDFFLAVLIGEQNRDFSRGAVAYHVAPNLVDFISTCSRNLRGRMQITEQFPALMEEAHRIRGIYPENTLLSKGIYHLCKIAESKDVSEAYQRSLSLLIRVLAKGVIKVITYTGKIGTLPSEWRVAKSTKRPIEPREMYS